MRKPKRETPLRQVRVATDMRQKEFAAYLGIRFDLYHSLELDRVGLTKSNADSISQKTGATPESIDPTKSKVARDFDGVPYATESWKKWKHRGIGWAGPWQRVQNIFDWARFLCAVAEKQGKFEEFSFELSDCLTKAMEKYDLRRPVEREFARTKTRFDFICTYGELRQNKALARKVGFIDSDANVPNDEIWHRMLVETPAWEPQTNFPPELADRLRFRLIRTLQRPRL